MKGKVSAGILGIASIMGGVDASTLNEQPIERVETVAGYEVKAEQIGDVVETTLPWKDQPGLTVAYDMGEPSITERLADKRTEQVIVETVDFGEGGFKIDVLLSEKPDTNRFCYQIEGAENYDFFYQPPLTAEEIAEGASRPPEIEGSYAVYHKTLKNHEIGKENYATGKVMHIPRPQVWEIGNEEKTKQWADLSYENGQLCVTAPQDFLDNADYTNGVRIDPTFGYTGVGGTSIDNENAYGFSRFTLLDGAVPTEPVSVTGVTFYGNYTTSDKSVVAGIYSNGNLVSGGSSDVVTALAASGVAWRTATYTTPVNITRGDYEIAVNSSSDLGVAENYYDNVAGFYSDIYTASTYTGTAPATIGADTNDSRMSYYATYSTFVTPIQSVNRINNGTTRINNGKLDL